MASKRMLPFNGGSEPNRLFTKWDIDLHVKTCISTSSTYKIYIIVGNPGSDQYLRLHKLIEINWFITTTLAFETIPKQSWAKH